MYGICHTNAAVAPTKQSNYLNCVQYNWNMVYVVCTYVYVYSIYWIFGIQNNFITWNAIALECQNLHIWAGLSSKVDVYEYSKTSSNMQR